MSRLVCTMRGASLVVLGMMLSSAPVLAGDFTFNSVSDDEIDWNDTANWAPHTIPTIADDATIVSGLLRGAEVHDDQAVHSLILDSGINVYRGGTLTVTSTITHNGGYFINDGTVFGNLVNNDYLSNNRTYFGDVTNNATGVVLSENHTDGSNSWTGNVVDNAGWILNSYGTWTGDVAANTGIIENKNGAIWDGDVTSNFGDIESIESTWKGDIDNSGVANFSGILNGSIHNSGALVVIDPLRGVKAIFNDGGNIGLDDGAANDTLSARSFSGSGTAALDFEPARGRVDKIILRGDYSADTAVTFHLGGSGGGRTIADVPFLVVGGDNTGRITLTDPLPADGIVSYRLARKNGDWVIATSLNDAPEHTAGALGAVEASLADATQIGLGSADACGRGAWMRGLGSRADVAGNDLSFSGAQFGYDLACLAVPHTGATLGIGITMGMANGDIGGPLSGDFQQSFGGLYADLVDGAFRAILQGQAGRTQYRVSDPGALLDSATLSGTSASFSGAASYALALGGIKLVPELGLSASTGTASSADFGDVGSMRLTSGAELAAHVGATLSADLALDGDLTLTPFAAVSLRGDLIAPSISLIDSAGNAVALPNGGLGSYVTLALGADLVHAGSLNAGLRTDFRLGAALHAASVSGHAKVSF